MKIIIIISLLNGALESDKCYRVPWFTTILKIIRRKNNNNNNHIFCNHLCTPLPLRWLISQAARLGGTQTPFGDYHQNTLKKQKTDPGSALPCSPGRVRRTWKPWVHWGDVRTTAPYSVARICSLESGQQSPVTTIVFRDVTIIIMIFIALTMIVLVGPSSPSSSRWHTNITSCPAQAYH